MLSPARLYQAQENASACDPISRIRSCLRWQLHRKSYTNSMPCWAIPVSADRPCENCPVRTFQNETAQRGCVPCQSNLVPGLTQCNAVVPGSFVNDTNGTELCHLGHRCSGQQRRARSMPAWHANIRGSVSCINCPPGRFSAQKAASECDLCPEGYAQSDERNSSCSVCTSGRYAATPGALACQDCAAGKFAPEEGHNRSCYDCP